MSLFLWLCLPAVTRAQEGVCAGGEHHGEVCADDADGEPGGFCDFSNGYALTWYTVDAGGVTFANGQGYRLGATAGQPDAGTLSGDGYTLHGGFWVMAGSGDVFAPDPEPGGPACVTATDCTGAYDGAACVDGVCYVPKNRFLSIDPTTNTGPVAYQVELTASEYLGGSVGTTWWVTEPVCADKDGNPVAPPCTGENVWRSQLVSTAPPARAWTENVVHLADCEVVPAATYAIRATAHPEAPTPTFSNDLAIGTIMRPGTKYWADCVGQWHGTQWTPPNGVVNMDDVMAAVFYFTNAANKPHRTWVEVDDEGVNMVLNFTDIMRIVQGFKGEPYPFSTPGDCPS